jgi:hypothetical protein
MHSTFLRFPKQEKLTGKSTDSNEVENWIFETDNLFFAQGNVLTEMSENGLCGWIYNGERIEKVVGREDEF